MSTSLGTTGDWCAFEVRGEVQLILVLPTMPLPADLSSTWRVYRARRVYVGYTRTMKRLDSFKPTYAASRSSLQKTSTSRELHGN